VPLIVASETKATARPGKVLAWTEAAAHVRTAETAAHVAATHMRAAKAAAYMATTAAHVTATTAAARKRVSCQSPGESGGRCQNDHGLT
jgi:hypothetical protein